MKNLNVSVGRSKAEETSSFWKIKCKKVIKIVKWKTTYDRKYVGEFDICQIIIVNQDKQKYVM